MRVKILRGIPGSGKSTLAQTLFTEEGLRGRVSTCVSADHYFQDDQGCYRWDRSKLGQAHGQCLRRFAQLLVHDVYRDDLLICDNTNISVLEMNPYVQLARAMADGYEVITLSCDPDIAAARNQHGVPVQKVWEMHKRLVATQIPRDWQHRYITL